MNRVVENGDWVKSRRNDCWVHPPTCLRCRSHRGSVPGPKAFFRREGCLQKSVDVSQQFVVVEWLGQVAIGTLLDAPKAIAILAFAC